MRHGAIYKITNIINNTIYIGQTLIDLPTRLRLHFEKVKSGRDSKLYRDMRLYDIENFKIEAIETNIPITELDRKEIDYIKKYDSIQNGYNTDIGGNGRSVYSDLDEELILDMVNKNISTKEISKELGVSSATIQRCLISKGIKRYDKIDDVVLSEMWHSNTINKIAEYFDVNEKTIRRHAKKLGLKKR